MNIGSTQSLRLHAGLCDTGLTCESEISVEFTRVTYVQMEHSEIPQ